MATKLTVLITNVSLHAYTGTEVYVRDFAVSLAARGHSPIVYTPQPGTVAEELRAAGIPVHEDLSTIGEAPDIIHGQHTGPTIAALMRFRRTPGIYVCHDRTWLGDLPPVFPRILRHVAVDYNCRERVVEEGIPPERIRVMFNAVDLQRFIPRGPLPSRPQRALLFSNYATEDTHLPAVRQACTELSLPLDVIGSGVGRPSSRPEDVLGQYDVVFAKARCALEAMAVGAAVVLCDSHGLGPLVTAAEVEELRRWNFGRRTLRWPLEPSLVRREIERYDPRDAVEVRRYVRAVAGLDALVDSFVSLYREVIAEHRRRPAVHGWRERRAAARALRLIGAPGPVRERLRRLPVLGPMLVMLKRAIFGTGRRRGRG